MRYSFTATLWKYAGGAAWYFVTVPKEYAAELRSLSGAHARNFGSIRVKARIGDSEWHTSVFPDSASGSFVLPVKKEIRTNNNLSENQEVACHLEVDESSL